MRPIDEARGSGFLVVQDDRPWLVTCRLNVDPADDVIDVRISDMNGVPVAIGDPILSPDHDIAFTGLPMRPGQLSGSPPM